MAHWRTQPTTQGREMRVADPWSSAGGRSSGRAARWLRDHRRVARDSLIFVSQRFWTSLLVWLLIGIALALPGGLYLVQTSLAAMSDSWEGRPGITVYLRVDADVQIGRALRDQLLGRPRRRARIADHRQNQPWRNSRDSQESATRWRI